jgi:hypothetical protein
MEGRGKKGRSAEDFMDCKERSSEEGRSLRSMETLLKSSPQACMDEEIERKMWFMGT